MNSSESLLNSLLIEVDSLTHRLRNIKNSFKTTSNDSLRNRLINENKLIMIRVNEIYNISNLLNKSSHDGINFSSLLKEKSRRTLNEIRTENNLFFI